MLNLGYSTNIPINNNDIKIIKSLSKTFNSIQIMYSKNNISEEETNIINKILKKYKNIFVHASYQINIGSELIPLETGFYNTSLDSLLEEIIFANKINAKGIVLHMGKNTGKKYNYDHIYNNMVKFIIELFKSISEKIPNNKTIILLETPAGQGGEMCWDLNDFVEFIQKFTQQNFYPHLGICIDTCHIFQAGYNLNNSKEIKQIHKIFSPIEDKIKLIHFNDSYYEVGKHIDRHEQIGKGYIQINKLIKFIHPYIKLNIPLVLETVGPYETQIKQIINSKL